MAGRGGSFGDWIRLKCRPRSESPRSRWPARLVRKPRRNPSSLENVNGRLWFRAITATQGRKLWTTDGTATITRLIADQPSLRNADPAELTAVGTSGLLFFSADDDVLGSQLWNLDTVNVPINPTLSKS